MRADPACGIIWHGTVAAVPKCAETRMMLEIALPPETEARLRARRCSPAFAARWPRAA